MKGENLAFYPFSKKKGKEWIKKERREETNSDVRKQPAY